MDPSRDHLRAFLDTDESLVSVYDAALVEYPDTKPATVGITDRRLIYVRKDGETTHLDLSAICSVHTEPYTTRRYRGWDHRVLMLGGSVLVLLGLAALIPLAADLLVTVLFAVTVSGVLVAAYIHRDPHEVDWRALQRRARLHSMLSDERVLPAALLSAAIAIATLAFLWLIVRTGSWLVVASVPTVLVGSAIVDFGRRNAGELSGLEIVERQTTEVSVGIVDGRTFAFRCEPTDPLEEDLARVAFQHPRSTTRVASMS